MAGFEPLELEATALPTEPQPLPSYYTLLGRQMAGRSWVTKFKHKKISAL